MHTYIYTCICMRIHTELGDTMYVPCMGHTQILYLLGSSWFKLKNFSSSPYRITTGALVGITQARIIQPGTGRNHTSK